MDSLSKYAAILAAYMTGCYVAAIVFGFGVLNLVTDQEVIPLPFAGPLVGPVMAGIAALIVFGGMLLVGRRARPDRRPSHIFAPLGIAAAAYITFAVAVPALFGVVVGDTHYFDLAVRMMMSPFSLLAAVLAGVIAWVYSLLVTRRAHGGTRPRWPWERPDDL